MNNDDGLISKLIEETCENQDEKETPNTVRDLHFYFEKKLNQVEYISLKKYLDHQNLENTAFNFEEHIKCYRIIHSDHVLDFPMNWSVFKELNSENIVFINKEIDSDFLIDIFSELTGKSSDILFVKENSQLLMILLTPESSKEHLTWIREYLEKNNVELIEKEAA